MTTSLSNYLSAKKKTYMILIVAALVVYLLVSLTGVRSYFWYTLLFWEAFVLLFLLGQCQLNLCRKKQAVIHEATELVARELEIPCANSRPWDEDQCRSALFFPKQVNAFYLERDIPHQIFTLEKQGGTLQYSHVSVGELFGSVKKTGNDMLCVEESEPPSRSKSFQRVFYSAVPSRFPFPTAGCFSPGNGGVIWNR